MMRLFIIVFICLPLCLGNCLAETIFGEILDDEIAAGADISVLEAEANSFNTINKGIALSLALCEGIDLCSPTVNRDELERFINALDARIGSLSQRYEESENAELEGVIVAYADARESYTKHLEKLGTIVVDDTSSSDDLFSEDDFFGGAGTRAVNQFDTLFNDADEELFDDEDLDELGDESGTELENIE